MTRADVGLAALEREGALEGLALDVETRSTRLQGHASTRRFYRLRRAGRASTVLVVYPHQDAMTGIAQFRRATAWYQAAGIRVPTVVAHGARALVVSDAGDLMLDAASADRRQRLYRQAGQVIVRLQRHGRRHDGPNPGWALDRARFEFEMDFLEEHGFGAWLQVPAGASRRSELYRELAARLNDLPRGLCHRDFHARNLMVSHDRIVVIDFQDTMEGPVFYDAASLLRDNYVDVARPIVRSTLAMLARGSIGAHPVMRGLAVPDWSCGLAPGDKQAFALTALERSLKALGTFGYQVGVAGRPEFAAYVPRTWAHVAELLEGLGLDRYLDALSAFDRPPA
jgi:hypothetical protein